LTYTVYAENRDIQKEWTIYVQNAKNSECDFVSFVIPDFTRSISINNNEKTIQVEVTENAYLKHLPVKFKLSPGASAWIGNRELISNSGTINFTERVQFRVLAEDGITSDIWTVTIQK
jgi:hypothetical protein